MLTRAHEREFGKISAGNKPIWQVAEEREQNKANGIENKPLVTDINEWHKALDRWLVNYFKLLFFPMYLFILSLRFLKAKRKLIF